MEKEAKVVVSGANATPQEKKKLKRPFVFQGQGYDLSNLTEDQKTYLKQFPDEVPFLK
ncbi:hypothetical protein [Runella sp.]|uniref:hypothetical protein n=1 Tax=Runella sp. TaxID=1960881 RepID=UPI003D0D373D